MVIYMEREAELHMAQLMPLPLTVSCFSKIHIGFTFLVPAHLGSPRKRGIKWVCECSMHHYECVALCKDISIQSGRFCARSLPSYILRSSEDRSSIMNVLHPSCARPPRWSPPVLWKRFKDVLASICILIHLCKMPKESERTDLMMDESGGWLVMRWCRHFWKSRANECPGFFVGTMVHCINLLYICLVYLLYICLDP